MDYRDVQLTSVACRVLDGETEFSRLSVRRSDRAYVPAFLLFGVVVFCRNIHVTQLITADIIEGFVEFASGRRAYGEIKIEVGPVF